MKIIITGSVQNQSIRKGKKREKNISDINNKAALSDNSGDGDISRKNPKNIIFFRKFVLTFIENFL